MKKILFVFSLLLITTLSFSQRWVVINGHSYGGGAGPTDPVVVAQFNFTPSAQNISGWTDVIGNPDATVVTASDTRSGQAVNITTVNSTDVAYWNPFSNNSALVTLVGSGHVLPTELYRSYFFQYLSTYTPGKEQIQISNLNTAKTYKFEFLSSRQGTPTTPTVDVRKTRLYCVDASGTTNQVATSANWNGTYNITFTGKIPVGGIIKIGIEKGGDGDFGYINAVKITQE